MPSYNLFIRDENRLHLDGFTVFVPNADGTPWKLENEPIPEKGLKFTLPTRDAKFSMFVRGPGHLRQPYFRNWTNWLTVSLKDGGDIILVIRDCEDIDCGPCEATKANPEAKMPALTLDEDQLKTLVTNDSPAPSHNPTFPVVSGPIDLKCVEVKVNVVDGAGTTLTDYLCLITPHQPPGPLTLTKEVGTGVSFYIRNARETYYAIIWKAGSYTTTAKRVEFNPDADADAKDGIVRLPYEAKNDTAPLPPAVARGYVKTPVRVEHRAGSIGNSSVFSAGPAEDPSHRYKSELCSSVSDGNNRFAAALAGSVQLQAKSSRLICFYNSDIGRFTMGDVGNYWWRAWRYLDDGSRGAVIEQDIDVHYLLVEWEL